MPIGVDGANNKILDTNGATVLEVTPTASGINHVGIANAAAAGDPTISAKGSETDVDLAFAAKGAGVIRLNSDVTLADGVDLAANTSTGTKIGTATGQKLGFWNTAPVIQPAHADQAATVMGNANSEISGLTISAAYDQAEVTALRDAAEELADDVRALHTLVHALRTALVNTGIVKGAA